VVRGEPTGRVPNKIVDHLLRSVQTTRRRRQQAELPSQVELLDPPATPAS